MAVSVLGKDRGTVEDVIRKKRISFKFLYDPNGKVAELFSGKEYPGVCPLTNIFIIGKDGKIVYTGRYPGTDEAEIISQLNGASR